MRTGNVADIMRRFRRPMFEGDVTQLLRRMAGESGPARKRTYDELVSLVYDELRLRAGRQIRRERADGSLRATGLVHEIYARLLGYRMPYTDRAHFLNVAATAMRRVLVERARKRQALRRGGDLAPATPTEAMLDATPRADPDLLIDVDRALASLAPEQVQLTELRFFAGHTLEEAADIMGIELEAAKKRWHVVKVRLLDAMTKGPVDAG